MKIAGKEIGFTLTVGASAEISKMCPEGDIGRIGEAMEGTYAETLEFVANFVAAMSKGYADAKKLEGEKADLITRDEIWAMPPAMFRELQEEAMAAFKVDAKSEIQIEDTAKKNTEDGGDS